MPRDATSSIVTASASGCTTNSVVPSGLTAIGLECAWRVTVDAPGELLHALAQAEARATVARAA
jgi:hypothetical protein